MHFDGIVFCIFFVSRLVVLLFSRLASKKISLSFPYLSSLGGAGVVVEFFTLWAGRKFCQAWKQIFVALRSNSIVLIDDENVIIFHKPTKNTGVWIYTFEHPNLHFLYSTLHLTDYSYFYLKLLSFISILYITIYIIYILYI